jgi:UDP-N-acetylmuramoyl-tripeptide--D-alanyl-D-alanine ligase
VSRFTWTDDAVRRALGLRIDLVEPDLVYSGVCTDSRSVQEGDLYVALVGDRFDGHDFVADALSRGAFGAVVSRPSPGDSNARLYPVDDTLMGLGRLAAFRRSRLTVPVVGITGSAGKTTTKEMTAAALGATLRVHATPGNLNNRIGMPLTLLAAPDDAEVVVLEMGTNEPGEIRALTEIARPDVAVITTVGESHLEKLGSLEGVLDEKLDILRYIAEGGRCVVGDAPPVLAERARALCPRVRVVGWSEEADPADRPAHADVDVFGRYAFDWKGQHALTPMVGKHAVSNALIALTVAEMLGVPAREAVRGLAEAEPGSMRGELQRIGDMTVIVDCYNANPQSVRASLDVLEEQAVSARKVAVLGSMLELGEQSDTLHDDVLADALARELDIVVATGDFSGAVERGGHVAPELIVAEDWRVAYPMLSARLHGDEIVLLKASRGIALEGMLPLLEEDFGPDRNGATVEADFGPRAVEV